MALAEALKGHKDLFKDASIKHILNDFPKDKGSVDQFDERVEILRSCLEDLATRSKENPRGSLLVKIKDAEIPTRVRQVFKLASGASQIVGAEDALFVYYNHGEEDKERQIKERNELELVSISNTKVETLRLKMSNDLSRLITSHLEEQPHWYTDRYQINPWGYYADGEHYVLSARAGLLDVLLLNPEYKGFQLELLEELFSVFNVPFFIPRPAHKA